MERDQALSFFRTRCDDGEQKGSNGKIFSDLL